MPVHSLRSLLPYFRPYRRTLAAGLLLVVSGNASALMGPEFLRRGIDALATGSAFRDVTWIAAGLVGVAVLAGAARYGMRECLNGASRRVEYDLRNALFRHLERLDAAFYQRTPTGDIMARATNDLLAVRMVAGPAIMYLTDTITRAAIAIPLMSRINWRLTALGLLPLSAVPVLMVVLGRAVHRRFEAIQEQFSAITTYAHENLSGVRVIRAYRQEAAETARFAELNEEYVARNVSLARLTGALFPLITFIGGLGAVAVLWFGSILVLRGTVSVGDFVAMNAYLMLLVWPVIALGWVINLLQRGAASMDRINALLAERPAIGESAAPRVLPPAHGGRSIEFRGAWFRYPVPRRGLGPGHLRRWALRDVSFTLPAGRSLAVVGPTGSGKSTLVELITRVADPDRGVILLDGVPLPELALADLRRAIGFVPQETFLFSETIRDNIALGTDDAAAVEAAARIAQLHDTAVSFPKGYDTMLGERGINLSGGQKQRAAIARALAKDPDVVILDDALSAVDTATEAEILRALRGALEGRTSLVVSHRISAIRDADWIIVLDDGGIVEEGVHQDLLERRGRYWQLFRRQQLVESLEAAGRSSSS